MSRIGKIPIEIPNDVKVTIDNHRISVSGPKGTLQQTFRPEVKIIFDGGKLNIERVSDSKLAKSQHGLVRTLVANMIKGVTEGWEKKLELSGVGYRALLDGKEKLILQVGYSHPVEFIVPSGIEFAVEGNNKITVLGLDKAHVGQIAAQIRKVRPPEPYKGKGIHYLGEKIRRKVGKTGKVGSTFGA